MSGAGKWIKKHPAESAVALLALGTGGAGLAGAGPLAGLLGSGAAAGAAGGASVVGGGTDASMFGAAPGLSSALLAPEAAVPTMATIAAETPAASGGLLAGMGKAEPYLKLAQMGMSMNEQPQLPPPQAPRGGGGGPITAVDQYADPELERRMKLFQQGGYYG